MKPAAGWRAGAAARAVRRARAAAPFAAIDLRDALRSAVETEWEQRRFFLWLPACAGTGVLLDMAADREPVLWLPAVAAAGLLALAAGLRRAGRVGSMLALAAAVVALGFLSAELRIARLTSPVLDRVRVARLEGVIEEVDLRRHGARVVLRVTAADRLAPDERPARVRLTTRRDDPLAAGDRVGVTARLLPPSPAALPGGYDFARDAFFDGFGAVGSVLGRVRPLPAGEAEGWRAAALAAIDRGRNALAQRVDLLLGGDVGAIGAAMVTGKRDLLSDDGREIIREAGIFHIITIAGVQMTLVAGLLFGLVRRTLALSPRLVLRWPVKKIAAAAAIAGACGYDVLTGSRIGTQRALLMTVIMLGAVLVDRRGFTLRNLALAALAVILLEPESVLGASFQLSFAAVAALIAVYEARERRREARPDPGRRPDPGLGLWGWPAWIVGALRDLLVATACATGATAPFMAAGFHELSPYVLVGNPITLGVIEFFAVPGALLGCVLYPLGLDGWVWSWVGLGIRGVLWCARVIGAAPASTLHVPAFAPWALPLLTLALLSAVIWRSLVLRLTAVPLALLGLIGAMGGPRYDLLVAVGGEAVAVRGPDGHLALAGRPNGFAAEQWLRADGDGRAVPRWSGVGTELGRCDPLACVVPLPGGQVLSLVAAAAAFAEDCRRADVIVTALRAPATCAASLILDRDSLARSGAVGFVQRNGGWLPTPARSVMEDRPWSRAPPPPRPPAPGEADPDLGPEATGEAAAP